MNLTDVHHHCKNTYWLICLSSTLITGVSGDLHHGLHLGGSGDYSFHGNQFPDAVSLDITNSQVFQIALCLKVQFTEKRI